VPLTREGDDSTWHLFDAPRLAAMKRGAILLNTSRGAVVETAALKEALRSGRLAAAVLDVWENEPDIDQELLGMVALGTPHIAGYSLDGKMNGVRMVYNALCSFLSVNLNTLPPFHLPDPDITRLIFPAGAASDEEGVSSIVPACYGVARDDRRLRSMLSLSPAERPVYFRSLRRLYPVRREFLATAVSVPSSRATAATLLRELGFTVSALL
jgi:erythronate-4-phosphate dehydrogenase